MTKLTILVGIPGSGKSTLASRMRNVEIVSSDAIRESLGDVNDQSQNDRVFRIFYSKIRGALRAGKHVVVDSTAVSRRSHELLLDIARKFDIKPTVVVFTDTEEAEVRNKNRDRVVPDHVMERMTEGLKETRRYLEDNSSDYNRIIEVN